MATDFIDLPNTRRTIRRAPHMEKYVKLRKFGGNYGVVLKVGVQSFSIGIPNYDIKNEAVWLADMLANALSAIVADHTTVTLAIAKDRTP